jgi:hypothetical protein
MRPVEEPSSLGSDDFACRGLLLRASAPEQQPGRGWRAWIHPGSSPGAAGAASRWGFSRVPAVGPLDSGASVAECL